MLFFSFFESLKKQPQSETVIRPLQSVQFWSFMKHCNSCQVAQPSLFGDQLHQSQLTRHFNCIISFPTEKTLQLHSKVPNWKDTLFSTLVMAMRQNLRCVSRALAYIRTYSRIFEHICANMHIIRIIPHFTHPHGHPYSTPHHKKKHGSVLPQTLSCLSEFVWICLMWPWWASIDFCQRSY